MISICAVISILFTLYYFYYFENDIGGDGGLIHPIILYVIMLTVLLLIPIGLNWLLYEKLSLWINGELNVIKTQNEEQISD